MDLTGFYYSIAGCSATIVAIIGGFIASKLISISSERDGIVEKLREVDELLSLKKGQEADITQMLEEDDALDFIKEHIRDLVDGRAFLQIYKPEEKERLEAPVLEKYWNESRSVLQEIEACFQYYGCEVNSDKVPNEYALKHEEGFLYDVAVEICKEFERRESPLKVMLPDFGNGVGWYTKKADERARLRQEISSLELEQKQYEDKKQAIKKPKGMKSGLIIFVVFALTGVVYPLVCAMLNLFAGVADYALALSVLLLFVAGVGVTFGYLAMLLRWKEN